MINLADAIRNSEQFAGISLNIPKFTGYADYMSFKCDMENNTRGNLETTDGINCDKCLNRGYIAILDSQLNICQRECSCMKQRRSVKLMRSSGLGELLKTKTFDTFTAVENWQDTAKKRCMDYAGTTGCEWLYIGGQSGCGKTHLCTAVCAELMKNGASVRYFLWNDLLHKLEAVRYDKKGRYMQIIDELKEPEVMYIDDFLKTSGGNGNVNQTPTQSALEIAFELINQRYIARKKLIISSEFLINDIAGFDRATAGRINEMTDPRHKILVNLDKGKDYRIRHV